MNYDFSNIPTDLILNILNIVILFVIVRFIVYKPVKKFIDGRKERVGAASAEADAKLENAKALEEEYNKKLGDAKSEAARIAEESESAARERAARTVADAEAQAGKIISDAENAARNEKAEIIAGVKPEIAAMSAMMAEKILQRTVDDGDTHRIAEEFFSSEESKNS